MSFHHDVRRLAHGSGRRYRYDLAVDLMQAWENVTLTRHTCERIIRIAVKSYQIARRNDG